MKSRPLNQSRYVTLTLGTLAHQHQITAFDGSAKMGDRHLLKASPAPHIGQQKLADVRRNGFPALAGGVGKFGMRPLRRRRFFFNHGWRVVQVSED